MLELLYSHVCKYFHQALQQITLKKKKKKVCGTKNVSFSYFQTFHVITWELWSPVGFTKQLWCLFAPGMTAHRQQTGRLLAKQTGQGCDEWGGGKKMAKRGTGKGNLPTGKLFSASYVTALSLHGSSCADHRHCPDDSGSSAHAVASQHRQAAMRLCQGKAQRWRHQDAKTDGRPCTRQSCGDLPARWQWSGGNWRHPLGVSAGVHDVLAPATGLIPTWNFLAVLAFEMDGSTPWHFGKNMTIFSRYLERCGWKYEWCLKHLTLSWNKEQLRLMYKH